MWRRAVNEWFQDPTNDALLTVLRDRLLVEQQRRYADALLLNPDGNVIVSASGQPDSIDSIEKKSIEEAVASGSVVLTDMYRTRNGAILMDVVAPILDTNGQLIATELYRINPESSLFPLIQSWPTPSQSAETLLVRRDGVDVLFLNDLRHRANTALSLREPLTLQDLPAVQAVTGKTGLFQGKDYRKVDVLADLRPIPDSPWFIVAKVDASEILAEANYRGAVVIIFSVIFIVLAGGLTAYAYKNRQALLYQDLYKSEREHREAQELFRTTLYSIGDAVITTDTGGLVQQMNPVAERLTGWQEAEAKGKSLYEVFSIVQEESRAPVENPVQRVLTEGKVVGLANHTVLISRDGAEFPIADSGAPIRSEDGSILGVVLVFREQSEERAAHEALRRAHLFTNALLENLLEGVVACDADGALVLFNKMSREWHGLDPVAIPQEQWADYYDLYCADGVTPMTMATVPLARAFRGEDLRNEGMVIRAKGRPDRHIVANCAPFFDEKGTKLGAVGVMHDITDRKVAEDDLRETQAILQVAMDQSQAGIAIADAPDGKLRYVNNAGLGIRGEDRETIVDSVGIDQYVGTWQLLDLDGTPLKSDDVPLARAIMYGETNTREFMIRNPSNENRIVWANAAPVRDDTGQIKAGVVVFLDITERKMMEDALKNSEARYRQLAEVTFEGIAFHDHGVLLQANDQYFQIFGYEPNELLGTQATEKTLSHESLKTVRERIAQRSTETYVAVGLRKDGTTFPIEIRVRIREVDGKEVRCAAIRDISRLKNLETQLVQAQKMEAVGTLTGGVAHDFNNLLQAITGYTELLMMGKEQGNPELDDLQTIYDSTQRGADLVKSLMLFSRKAQPELRPVNLNHEIVQVQQILSRTIPKTIEIVLRLSGKLETIQADPSQIGQVLMNLGVNARDAMPDGGTLTIETTNVHLDKDYCAVQPEVKPGPYVLLNVSDTGHGMDRDTVEHIFDPFFTTKEVGKGTGLGLATVYGIVKEHKGHITCYSEPGQGTIFKIYLPAIQTETTSEHQKDDIPIQGGTETILLVEDEESLRLMGSKHLNQYGYHVITASNGREALDIYQKEGKSISLIVLDMIMPVMVGRKCLEEILGVNPNAKVIIASGASEEGSTNAVQVKGAKGSIRKPYDIRQLLLLIREVLDKN